MNYNLLLDFKPQKEWDKAPLWMEMAAGAIGGGTFIVSVITGFKQGMIVGFAIAAVIKGLLLLIDLGKPLRAFRVFTRPFSSWLSFGAVGFALFCLSGAIFVAPMVLPNAGLPVIAGAKVVALVTACVVILYDGFLLNASRGVAFWNSSVLPVLFGVSALSAGTGLVMLLGGTGLGFGANMFILGALAFVLFAFLYSSSDASPAGKVSVQKLIKGDLRGVFMICAVLLGVIVPLLVLCLAAAEVAGFQVGLILAGVCQVIGTIAVRYAVLKAGTYTPAM